LFQNLKEYSKVKVEIIKGFKHVNMHKWKNELRFLSYAKEYEDNYVCLEIVR
jgi:hypothetical protein